MLRFALLLPALLAAVLVDGVQLALAAPKSCFASAADERAFNECAQAEILPLEARLVSRINALRAGGVGR